MLNWYSYGEGEFEKISSANRLFWHRLVYHYLQPEHLNKLIFENILNKEDLKPFSESELKGIDKQLRDRIERYNIEFSQPETPYGNSSYSPEPHFDCVVKFSPKYVKTNIISFDKAFITALNIEKYILPFPVFIKNSTFQNVCVINDCVFVDHVDFSHCIFLYSAYFQNSTFCQDVYFYESSFALNAFFNGSKFLDYADFSNTFFSHFAEFENTTYKEMVDFRNSNFKSTTDFSDAQFQYPPIFHGSELYVDTIWHNVKWPEVPSTIKLAKMSEQSWSTLKFIMNKVMRHDAELMFFAKELEAKNAYKGKSLSYRFYKATSNLGQSIERPFWWLFGTFISFSIIYFNFYWANVHLTTNTQILRDIIGQSALLSFVNSFPFVGIQRYVYQEVSNLVYFIGAVQTILSTIFLFLIGLGIRNKYRIK